jgi:predicted DNA-binding transcriptional regulator AlpA
MLMKSKRPTQTALSIPAFGHLLGLSSARIYQIMGANRGPKTQGYGRQSAIPLDSAITWIEGELQTLYRTGGSPQRRRRYEDAARTLRVERVLERAQARQRQQRFGFADRRRYYTSGYDHQEATP